MEEDTLEKDLKTDLILGSWRTFTILSKTSSTWERNATELHWGYLHTTIINFLYILHFVNIVTIFYVLIFNLKTD